jgi:hypothetical protein
MAETFTPRNAAVEGAHGCSAPPLTGSRYYDRSHRVERGSWEAD